jgi:DNA-binding CsgD family transcriptional regulator
VGFGAAPSAHWLFTPRPFILAAPSRGTTSRYRSRSRRLSPDDEREIARLSGHLSLRSIAAHYGVSYETIRTAVRRFALPERA